MRERKLRGVSAFTLIELLVVIAIIGMLLAVLIPALQYAKVQATAVICLANLNGMSKAFVLYSEDNSGDLVGSGTAQWNAWQNQRRPAWDASAPRVPVKNFVAFPQDENHNFRNIRLEDKIRGFQQGGLWPYTENHKLYHCPSDKRHLSPPAGLNPPPPNEIGGYRTYSIGCVVNGYGIGDGWATGEYYALITKMGEFRTPGQKIVFVEEQDGQGYNINTWNIYLDDFSTWKGDPLACTHNERSTMGYADGHAEKRHWVDETTVYLFENQVKWPHSVRYKPGEGEDIRWFIQHYLPGEIRPELRAMMPSF
ncbi:MAG TPA: type II secretion system protein [Phycisphaerales bacterium]|nr:type II secretion system protein [Phycisphaerales bacterium]